MSNFRTRFPAFFRFAALLALWAILVPVGISVFHTPAAMAHSFHYCGIGSQTDSGADKHPNNKLPPCPVCKSMQMLGGGLVPPDAVVVIQAPLVAATYIVESGDFSLKLIIPPQARPRAPPRLV